MKGHADEIGCPFPAEAIYSSPHSHKEMMHNRPATVYTESVYLNIALSIQQ